MGVQRASAGYAGDSRGVLRVSGKLQDSLSVFFWVPEGFPRRFSSVYKSFQEFTEGFKDFQGFL